jgi:hypothetical protein
MTTRNGFNEAPATLFDEAVAIYEAAKEEFEALQRAILEQLRTREFVPVSELNKEELARVNLFYARERLSRHKRP